MVVINIPFSSSIRLVFFMYSIEDIAIKMRRFPMVNVRIYRKWHATFKSNLIIIINYISYKSPWHCIHFKSHIATYYY